MAEPEIRELAPGGDVRCFRPMTEPAEHAA
jgi:hypothetical protein